MKTGTLDKMKFMVLKTRLNVPRYQVMGLLEGIWYLTATNAHDGAIGRFSDVEIAAWLEWSGDPASLIDALVESRFLDRSREHRLVVHDWADHAPMHVKANLSKHHKGFAEVGEKEPPKDIPIGTSKGDSQGTLPGGGKEPPSYSNLTKPNQTQEKHIALTSPDPPPVQTPPAKVNGTHRFTKPTIPQIREYVSELPDCSVDPAAFWNHYETVGWRVGKSPMKDWKAAVRTWNLRNRQ